MSAKQDLSFYGVCLICWSWGVGGEDGRLDFANCELTNYEGWMSEVIL